MRTTRILLLLMGFGIVLPILVSAQVRYTASVPVVLEDFETTGSWGADFSALKCDTWEGAEWAQANGGSTGTAQNPNAPANQQAAATPANTNASGNQQDSGEWVRWLSVDNIPSEKRLTFLPLVMQKDQKDKSIMGLKACWKNPDYNWVSVSPKTPLYTPAFPVSLSMYVWGNNYKYDIYVVVKNSEGSFYNLPLGSLRYAGWRELRVNFPYYVFPSNKHNTNTRLEIVKIRILTNPNEDSIGFYTYFDNMVIQQAFEQSALYDGASLNDEKW